MQNYGTETEVVSMLALAPDNSDPPIISTGVLTDTGDVPGETAVNGSVIDTLDGQLLPHTIPTPSMPATTIAPDTSDDGALNVTIEGSVVTSTAKELVPLGRLVTEIIALEGRTSESSSESSSVVDPLDELVTVEGSMFTAT